MPKTKILITGGCGFVGAHLIEHILKNTDWDIVSLDRYDSSGNPNRLSDALSTLNVPWKGRVKNVFWDLKAELNEGVRKQMNGPFDYIAHLAAGSHVDRSIEDPNGFFLDNCMGTVNLLNYAAEEGLVTEENFSDDPLKEMPIKGKFLYFSTDEVYGPAPETVPDPAGIKANIPFEGFKEWARLNPNNPYAAAKAAAEMACIAYANTYSVPIVITNTMNIFGERQAPEKFIPLIINKVLKGETLYIHANKEKTQAGKRHYLHARNICAATLWVLKNGKTLDGSAEIGRYNIVGEKEVDNLAMARLVESYVREVHPDAPPLNAELVDFHSSRPGHDLRYALSGDYLRSEGFSYPVSFEDSLRKMVHWTLAHHEWL